MEKSTGSFEDIRRKHNLLPIPTRNQMQSNRGFPSFRKINPGSLSSILNTLGQARIEIIIELQLQAKSSIDTIQKHLCIKNIFDINITLIIQSISDHDNVGGKASIQIRYQRIATIFPRSIRIKENDRTNSLAQKQ